MIKYALKKPIAHGDDMITELRFRDEVVAGDLRGIRFGKEGLVTEDLLRIAGRLCGQTDPVMSKLSMPDFCAVSEMIGGFLGAGLTLPSETMGSESS